VAAQTNTATILEHVTGSAGAVAPNAVVTAHNLDTGVERSGTSNEEGLYEIRLLPIGRYRLAVTGDNIRLDFTLQPGAVSETVNVTATAPLVNSSSPQMGTVIESRKVSELPINSRNFVQLMNLQTAVQPRQMNSRQLFPAAPRNDCPALCSTLSRLPPARAGRKIREARPVFVNGRPRAIPA
jgi:hypothetical protein